MTVITGTSLLVCSASFGFAPPAEHTLAPGIDPVGYHMHQVTDNHPGNQEYCRT
jgi:hypothetical protein